MKRMLCAALLAVVSCASSQAADCASGSCALKARAKSVVAAPAKVSKAVVRERQPLFPRLRGVRGGCR